MIFTNHTPYPAVSLSSIGQDNNRYRSVILRIKYAFNTKNDKGMWQLKIADEQDKLRNEEVFYENNTNASIRFTDDDMIPYKPHADLIVNAFTHSKTPQKSWLCGVLAERYFKIDGEEKLKSQTLAKQWLKVWGKRHWKKDNSRWNLSDGQLGRKISTRYENAYGGSIPNIKYNPDNPKSEKKYLQSFSTNPVGIGSIHPNLMKKDGTWQAPQIESMYEPIEEAEKVYMPQGFGAISRAWEPRISLFGTFDKTWEKQWVAGKHVKMADSFDETYYNVAHPNLQLEGYFRGGDVIILHGLLTGDANQGFMVPKLYFNLEYELEEKKTTYLEIDTIVVDILDDDIKNNAVYVSYRKRIPYYHDIEEFSIVQW